MILNAAAALVVAGRADTVAAGLELARAAIDDGRATATLNKMAEISQSAAGES